MSKRVYIARKYYAHKHGAQSIEEESVFETYDTAYHFIKEISTENFDRSLSEIVSYLIGDKYSYENFLSWTFDRRGNLIRFHDAQKRYENIYKLDPKSFSGKFKAGDMVIVRAYPWNEESVMPEDVIGVVIDTPVFYEEWIQQGNKNYEWYNTYSIYYIRDGYLEHMLVTESNLKSFDDEIPKNLAFLSILSRHYKGEITIKADILKKIKTREIFVEKVHHFNENESIKK